MSIKMPIVEARNKLTSLPEQFEQQPENDVVVVTRRGQPVLAIMPWELYDSIVETLEIMGDAELMAQLRESIKQVAAGETISWETVKKELDL
jgi:antitoxin YefM